MFSQIYETTWAGGIVAGFCFLMAMIFAFVSWKNSSQNEEDQRFKADMAKTAKILLWATGAIVVITFISQFR